MSGFSGWMAGIMMIIALVLTVAEIIIRTGFSKTLYITDEYSGYLMAMLTFCGLAYTLRERVIYGFSMIVMTAPLVLPLIEAAKFDTVWFGIYLVLMIELAQITPPVGFNLFVISGLNNDDIFHIARAALPFFFLMLLATVLITVFPQIALFLPGLMK